MTTNAPPDLPRDPRIKPLVWSCSDDCNEDWLAESPFGPFNAYFDDGHGWLVQLDGHDDAWAVYPDPDYGFANAHLARVACETEYLRRADLLLVDTPAQTVTEYTPIDVAQKLARFRAHMPDWWPAPVTFAYTNYKGEHGIRTVTPQRVWYGCTQYHPNNGWLLTGYDHDKKAERDFALTDIEFLNVTEEGS